MQTEHHAPTQTIFFSSLYGETVRLLHDAHDYFAYFAPEYQAKASPVEKIVYSAEMSRITLRLSAVMAWLLARRAEHSGQISREEALERFRLAFDDICLKELPEMDHILPPSMCLLMERSLDLYRRAHRLDGMVAETATVH